MSRHNYQSAADAIELIEQRTGEPFKLKACPHCGHSANLCDRAKSRDVWGGYDWEIACSSSHCRARVVIVADGWFEQLDGDLNGHIPKNRLYRDRVTDLRDMWNRRPLGSKQQAGG